MHPGNKLGMSTKRKSYPSDVSDEEWSFCVSYLTLMDEGAPQREYPLREIFNALRYLVRMGGAWRMMPHDLPPWHVVYQQTQRWIKAGCFEALAHDLRALLRLALELTSIPAPLFWTVGRSNRLPRAVVALVMMGPSAAKAARWFSRRHSGASSPAVKVTAANGRQGSAAS